MTPLQRFDGTLAFDNDIVAVLNIIPVDTVQLLNKIDDKYANIPDVSTDMLVGELI